MAGSKRDGTAQAAAAELAELRDLWLELLPAVTPEAWGSPIGTDGPTIGELFAALVADLDLVSPPHDPESRAGTPDTTPAFALEFIQRRLARKFSQRYSLANIGAELERRQVLAMGALLDNDDAPQVLLEDITHRMRERLVVLRSALRC